MVWCNEKFVFLFSIILLFWSPFVFAFTSICGTLWAILSSTLLFFRSLIPYVFVSFVLSLISKIDFLFLLLHSIQRQTDYYSAKKHTFSRASLPLPTIAYQCLPMLTPLTACAYHWIDFNVRQTFGSGVTQLTHNACMSRRAEPAVEHRSESLHNISLIIMCSNVRLVSLF